MVLQGETSVGPQSHSTIIPELQNRSVISVVVGRDHFGALTSSGKLLTWGKYSGGALGLEDPSVADSSSGDTGGERAYTPPEVEVPTEVRFDQREQLMGEGGVKTYCFAVAAYENHTAALVVDLAGDEILPEYLNQNALRDVSSSFWCATIRNVKSPLADSTSQSVHNPHTGPVGGNADLQTHIHFV